MGEEGFDPRAVANFLLDARDFLGLATTQIELQKLLYFSHEAFLLRTRLHLVSGYFEAWQYGPVHPVVYSSFKASKGQPITNRATSRNIHTGEINQVRPLDDLESVRHVTETVARLSGLSAGQLIDLSHATGGPWHSTVESAKKSVALGLRITDDVILQSRPHSMLMREGQPAVFKGRVPIDETPLTRNRSR